MEEFYYSTKDANRNHFERRYKSRNKRINCKITSIGYSKNKWKDQEVNDDNVDNFSDTEESKKKARKRYFKKEKQYTKVDEVIMPSIDRHIISMTESELHQFNNDNPKDYYLRAQKPSFSVCDKHGGYCHSNEYVPPSGKFKKLLRTKIRKDKKNLKKKEIRKDAYEE